MLDFGKEEIKQKRFRFLLVFFGLVICVSSTIFLITVSQSLGFSVFSSSSKMFTASVSNVISSFMGFEVVVVFFIGVLTMYFLSSTLMAGRVRDIGLVKALGSAEKNAFGYLMSAPLIVMFFASLVGGLAGFSVSIAVIVCLFGQSFLSIVVNSLLISAGVTVVFFLLSWVVVSSQTAKALNLASVSLLSGDDVSFDFKKEKMEFISKFAQRLSSSLSVALKNIFRSKSRSKISFICLSACILLITVSFVGNFVCWNATRGYVDNVFEQNVLIIGKADFVSTYQKMLDPRSSIDVSQNQAMSASDRFTDSSYIISQEFIDKASAVNGVISVDKRLAVFTHVMEVKRAVVEIDRFNEPHYVTYGEYRSADCLVVGVDPNQWINGGNIFDNTLGTSTLGSVDNAFIGDSLSEAIFQNPYKQGIEIYSDNSIDSVNFNIANIITDPLNHGYVVYIPVSELQELFSVKGFNFVLAKTDGYDKDTLLEVTQLASQYGLTVNSLDTLHSEYISSIDKLWLSILPFTLLTVITAMVCLLNCMFISISSRFHDFGIIRAIGAKSNYLSKIVFFECLILVIATAPIGITLGITFDLLFLIPTNTISLPFTLYALTTIISILLGMCILCTLIIMHLKKQTPHELLQ
ncbi:MAG: ABC transporter permease [Nitrososphaerota archaeon]|jgi:ABC-type antimicrobial peptide transport system permease subunit|nr:ABC transporter permease [Nitrososphaerota archaeon]